MQKSRLWIPVAIVVIIVLIVLLNLTRNDAVTQERLPRISDDMLKILTDLRNDHLCKVKQGYKYAYLDALNVCMSCMRICDDGGEHMKEVCAFGCQEYMILRNVEDMIHTNDKVESTKASSDDGLISRITELESISSKFKVLEDLKNRIDGISQTLTDNEAKLKKEITRVENDQGDMIEELQNAMDAVEKWQRFLLVGLACGCFAMCCIIGLAFCLFNPTKSHLMYKAIQP